MGTVFTVDLRPPGAYPVAVEEAVQWLHEVDATFSTYRVDSQINRLARGELDLSSCTPEVVAVLQRCAELEQETGGFFSARPAGTLDPSGYVKGWATQTASDMLVAAGSTNHCVNGGGDVQCASASPTPTDPGTSPPSSPGPASPSPPPEPPNAEPTSWTPTPNCHRAGTPASPSSDPT
jgi:thiamine biosynthesis lipoprotein